MKKSLLSLSLLFSLWSFAVINMGSDFTIVEKKAPETQVTSAKPAEVKKAQAKAAKAAATTLNPTNFPLEKGSVWSYLDNGTSLDAANWKVMSYDNAAWATGMAPLGYGDPTATVISFGPDSGNKYITSYFSKDVYVDLAELTDMVEFGIRRDDGAVVYVNGVEVIRENMAAGPFTYLTFSSTIVDGADEKRYFTHDLPKSVFQNGVNRISVEMHNRDGQSSDIGFDMYIQNAPAALVCNDNHISCFTSIMPTAQTPNLIMPVEQRFQMMLKEGSAYTVGTGTIAGNHDFTGYVSTTDSSVNGYLSVNHENNPGGVTMAGIHFDETTQLWVTDSSQPVDFFNTDLVTTIRNCSGGVTPWGTIVTAEENTSGGDTNGDGYNDVGWLVEIDPVTKMVKEYGNGKQEKLWKMGRMNHENVVVNEGGTRAYYGEDGGTHCVYKFVPTTPGNLYSGSVYVLKMDLPLSNDEPSSSTAQWVLVPNATPADCNNISAVAGALGGTNFNGVEDCEISPVDGMVYFTSKGKNRTYRFTDNGSNVTNFETFVGGMSYPLMGLDNVVADWKDGNDNLTFDDRGNLWVVQDGGDNLIWVVSPDHTQSDPKVRIHSSAPSGSEPTGLTFTPDYKYGFFSIQHPDGSNTPQMDATFNQVQFNASASLVFAAQENLGAQTPEADFMANEVMVGEGETVTFTDLSTNNPTSWLWTFEGGTPATSTEAAPTVTYATAGTYNVTLTTSNAAGGDAVSKTDYIVVEVTAGLNPNTLGNAVRLYPNPTNGIVNLELNAEAGKDVVVEIYDLTGRRLMSRDGIQTLGAGQNIEMNLSQFAGEQVFIINVKVGEKTGAYKLLKVK